MKILLFLLFLALPAHADIVIGVAGPMTGPYAAFGQAMQNGAQLAVDDANAKGGINGEMLVLQPEDDSCDNRKAEIVAQDLVAKNAKLVVGHFCSNPALAAAKIYQKAGIVMIAPTASLPSLTDAGLKNVIRIASRDDAQADMAAKALSAYSSVAVLGDGTKANTMLVERLTANFTKPANVNMTFKPDATDFDGIIKDIKFNNITALYLACSASDAAHIALAIKAAGLHVDLFGSDALLVDQFWEVAGDSANGAMATISVDPLSALEAKSVISALKTSGIEATGAAVSAYAAVQLFVANPNNTVDSLKSGAVFETVVGPLSFNEKGDVREPRFVWYRWENGKYSQN